MDYFPLTEKDVHEGLTDNRMSELTGVKVTSIPFSALPFSGQMQTEHRLPWVKKIVRAATVSAKLHKAGNSFPFRYAMNAAQQYRPANFRGDWILGNLAPPSDEYIAALREGKGRPINSNGPDGAFVWWCAYCENIEMLSIMNVMRGGKSFTIFIDPKGDAREYWSLRTGIPPELLKNVPTDGMHILHDKLHELTHAKQIQLPEQFYNQTTDYYAEVHADVTANATMRKLDIGSDTLKFEKNYAYFRLIAPDLRYQGPLAIDALEFRKKPPDFDSVTNAMGEIYIRLGMDAGKIQHRNLDSTTIQAAFAKCDLSSEQDKLNGAPISQSVDRHIKALENVRYTKAVHELFTPLRRLVEDRVFTDSLSAQIADRMIGAAEYFNPALTHGGEWRPKTIVPVSNPKAEL